MQDIRDLINLLIDPKITKSTCFMCFKQYDKVIDIYNTINIESQWFTATLSLKAIIKYVFPMQEIILQQACDLCVDVLISTYITLRRKVYIEKYLHLLINKINEQMMTNSLISNKKLYIETELTKNLDDVHPNDSTNIDNNIDHEVTSNIEERENCPICSKSFVKNQLKTHMRQHRHRKRKIYSCDLCEYRTKCKTTLEGHKNNKHFQKRPHKCINCQKCFYTKSALDEHSKTHKHTKDIVCEICGDSFYHSKSLKDHLKLHSNDKTFECYVCNHRFVNLSRVNNHMKQKHGEKKEFCIVCAKRFVFKKDMRRHMKLVHKQVELSLEAT